MPLDLSADLHYWDTTSTRLARMYFDNACEDRPAAIKQTLRPFDFVASESLIAKADGVEYLGFVLGGQRSTINLSEKIHQKFMVVYELRCSIVCGRQNGTRHFGHVSRVSTPSFLVHHDVASVPFAVRTNGNSLHVRRPSVGLPKVLS